MPEVKNKQFTAHKNLIHMVIERQAGTVAKPVLEASARPVLISRSHHPAAHCREPKSHSLIRK